MNNTRFDFKVFQGRPKETIALAHAKVGHGTANAMLFEKMGAIWFFKIDRTLVGELHNDPRSIMTMQTQSKRSLISVDLSSGRKETNFMCSRIAQFGRRSASWLRGQRGLRGIVGFDAARCRDAGRTPSVYSRGSDGVV